MTRSLDHTIILRTANRVEWLCHTVSQYASLGYNGNLLILDDSSHESFLESKNRLSKNLDLESLQVEHVRGSGIIENIERRWDRVRNSTLDGISLVKTKYFSVTSDDDLIFPEFIEMAVKLLDQLPHYSCVLGDELKIIHQGNSIRAKHKPWFSCSLHDPLDRLVDYFTRPTLAYYGVCKRECLDLLINKFSSDGRRRIFDRNGTPGMPFYDEEIPWVALVYIWGRIYHINRPLMGLRNVYSSLDRIENKHKVLSDKDYSLGPIHFFSKTDSPISLRETHDDLCVLILEVGTKYEPQVISDVVYILLWGYIRRVSGENLDRHELDYFELQHSKYFNLERLKLALITRLRIGLLIASYRFYFNKMVRGYLTALRCSSITK